MQPRTTRCDQRPAERHGALVALALSCILTGLSCHGTRPAAGLDHAQEPQAVASTLEEPTPDAPTDANTMVNDDAAAQVESSTSLTLTFLPGRASDPSAPDVIGTMADIVVDTDGTWHLPAVCFVADGLVPVGWQVALNDEVACDLPTLPVATAVCGLTAQVPSSDGAAHEVDLAPFVQDGTLTLTAVWEQGASEPTRDADHAAHESEDDADDIDALDLDDIDHAEAPLVGADDVSVTRDKPAPEKTATEELEGLDPFDESYDLDGAGTTDGPAQREDEAGTVRTKSTPEGASDRFEEPALAAQSELRATEPVTAGDAVAIVHGTTLTLTRVEGAPPYEWTGAITDVLGNGYEGTCHPVDEAAASGAGWAGRLAGVTRAEVAAGVLVRPRSCAGWFRGAEDLTEADLEGLDLSRCTSLSSMFEGCSSLAELDVSGWDVGYASYLAGTFRGCSSLASLDVSAWSPRAAMDLSGLFEGCSSLEEADVSSWNVRRAASMGRMFAGCSSLTSVDLSRWNTRRLEGAPGMFSGCSSLASLDLGGLDTSQCGDLSRLLEGCASLASVDLTALDTSSATRLEGLLPEGGALRRVTLGAPFSFSGANIQDPEHRATMPASAEPPHTGRWALEGTQTVMAASEIEEGYDGTALAGTWVAEVGWAPLALGLEGGRVPAGETYPQWYRLGEATALPGTQGSDLAAPVRPGFAFFGWVDEGGDPVDEIGPTSTGTRTVTATWEPAQVRVTVPVALTLAGTPDGEGTLSLSATDVGAVVSNDGDAPTLVSLALTNAPASLELSIPGDGDAPVGLSASSQRVSTLGAGDALALSGLCGSVGEADVSAGTPVGTLAWTFAPSTASD